MKIVCGIASRARWNNLTAVVTAFHRLRSGQHDVSFAVATDDDDPGTSTALLHIAGDIPVSVSSAPPVPAGDKFERLYQAADPESAFVLLTDRMFPLTQGWDHAIAAGLEQHPERVLWWQCAFYDGATAPILGPVARRALPQLFSGIFPFWFDDNWLEEIDLLCHGAPRICVPAVYGGERFGKTREFRDYPFWVEVFIATRPRRIAIARQACARLGKEWVDRPDLMRQLHERDALWRDKAPAIEMQNRTEEAPSARYLAAKRRAELIMNEEQAA